MLGAVADPVALLDRGRLPCLNSRCRMLFIRSCPRTGCSLRAKVRTDMFENVQAAAMGAGRDLAALRPGPAIQRARPQRAHAAAGPPVAPPTGPPKEASRSTPPC